MREGEESGREGKGREERGKKRRGEEKEKRREPRDSDGMQDLHRLAFCYCKTYLK